MRTNNSLLASLRPFARHDPDLLAVLDAQSDRLTLRPGTVVARRGARAREAVVVLAGEVHGEDDDGLVLGPGAWLGHEQLLTGRPHDETLVVGGAGATVVVVNAPAYRWALRALPGFADDAGGAAGRRVLVTGGRPGR
jgi:hypothetical protein